MVIIISCWADRMTPTKILIVGTGFGGTYTAKNLYRLFGKDEKIEVSIIGPQNYFLFTPLLHEVATGALNSTNIIEPIRGALHKIISNFYLGKVLKVNSKNKTVETSNGTIAYDYLVLAIGSETNFYNIPGAKENSITLKTAEDALSIKKKVICQMEQASQEADSEKRKKLLTFAVIGAGPTGVELAIELQELIKGSFKKTYKKELIDEANVVLIHRSAEILPQFSTKIRQKSLEILKKVGVIVEVNSEVQEIKDGLIITNSKNISAGTIVWVAGIKPNEIAFDIEVQKNNGKLVVNEYLQLVNDPNIFVIGDISSFRQNESYLPALAQVAEREAEGVARNIYNLLNNKKLVSFHYKHRGSLLSLGRWMAAGQIGSFTFYGHFTWWLWRTIYLSKLLSTRKKVNVAIDWTLNLFSPRDTSEI